MVYHVLRFAVIYRRFYFLKFLFNCSSENNAVPNSTDPDDDDDTTVTPPPATKNDVFLSFRGETRSKFTGHLYEALCSAGIQTYMDHKLHKGAEISEVLLRTIEESEISVIVFSGDYASSTWCLEELVKIMECKEKRGKVAIPVFYNVDPSDIRKQRGSYGASFAKLEQRFKGTKDKGKLQVWRDALARAAGLSGWDSKNVR